MSHQFELALRQYVAVFDGKNDAPEEFQAKFDALYGPQYTYVPKGAKADQKGWDCIGMELTDQEPIGRAAFFEAEKAKYASGAKVTLVHLRKIGLDCFDIKTETGDSSFRVITTICEKQCAISREIDDGIQWATIESAFKNLAFKFVEFGTHGTNM